MPGDPLLEAITTVCRIARETAGRKQVHIAAQLDVDQSTVARWERGEGWPRSPQNAGVMVQAYAEDLGLDAISLWQEALEQWRAARLAKEGDPEAAWEQELTTDDQPSEQQTGSSEQTDPEPPATDQEPPKPPKDPPPHKRKRAS